jgi:hypothetical protein
MRLAWAVALLGCGSAGLAGCGFKAEPAAQSIDAPAAGLGNDTGSATVDAPSGFSLASCPATYTAITGAPSRYRVIMAGAKIADQITACNADLAGATHLVVVSSADELTAIVAYFKTLAAGMVHNDTFWVGAVQLRDQPQPNVGWLGFDDNPVVVGLWKTGEPNDNGGGENNDENFAALKRDDTGISDTGSGNTEGALCECDGVAIGPQAMAAITANLTAGQ